MPMENFAAIVVVVTLLFLVRMFLNDAHTSDHSSRIPHPGEDHLDNSITSDKIAPQKDL